MSPKLADIDLGVAKLKMEGSTSDMRAAARAKLSRRSSNRLPKYGLVGLTAGVAIFVAYPRLTAGRTWAQALDSSSKAQIVHYVCQDAEGKLVTDEWTKDGKTARVTYLRSGQIFQEWRTDGKHLFNYLNVWMEPKNKNPNQHDFAMINSMSKNPFTMVGNFGGRLEKLMEFEKSTIVSQKEATTSRGAAIVYELHAGYPARSTYYATVDKKSGLIVETAGKDGKWKATYDYPETVDETIFEPRPQMVKGVEVYDIVRQTEDIERDFKKGLGTSKGVTLRLVALSSSGTLWAFWTGSPVSGKMERGFSVAGLEMGRPYGPAKFTTSAKDGRNAFEKTLSGARIYGMSREAKTKVGDTVDISIPIKGGYANFKQVPVMRLGFVNYFWPWQPRPSKKNTVIYFKPPVRRL